MQHEASVVPKAEHFLLCHSDRCRLGAVGVFDVNSLWTSPRGHRRHVDVLVDPRAHRDDERYVTQMRRISLMV